MIFKTIIGNKFLLKIFVLIRLLFFVIIMRRLKYIKKGKETFKDTTKRNLKSLFSLRDCYAGERSDFFLKKLKKIKFKDLENKKILIVGPRNEGEIFNFVSKGFRYENIFCIDLISYTNKIKLMDVNKYLRKFNYKFDLIYLGFVYGYLRKSKSVIDLSYKRLNKDGIIAITNEVNRKKINLRYKDKKFNSLVEIQKNFKKKFNNLISCYYSERLNNKNINRCMLVVNKV